MLQILRAPDLEEHVMANHQAHDRVEGPSSSSAKTDEKANPPVQPLPPANKTAPRKADAKRIEDDALVEDRFEATDN